MHIKIMRGIPGSGKSTIAKNISDKVVSADNYFMVDGQYCFNAQKLGEAHRQCFRDYLNLIQAQHHPTSFAWTIVVDNTNINIEDIAPYVAAGEALGHSVEILQINADPAVAAARNVHGVPAETVARMAKTLAQTKLPRRWTLKVIG